MDDIDTGESLPLPSDASEDNGGESLPNPGEYNFTPEQNPTRLSQLERTPEFLKGTFSDIPTEIANQAKEGWQTMTRPSDGWGDLATSMPSRALGALAAIGSPQAAITPLVGHPLAAALHGVGSIISPEQAALDVPDTAAQPFGGPQAGMLGQIDVEKDKPRGLYSQFTQPAASFAPALATPSGYSPIGADATVPMVPAKQLKAEDVLKAGSQNYDKLRSLGIEFDPNITSSWADDIQNSLRQEMGPAVQRNAPKVWSAIGDLKDPLGAGLGAKTLDEIDSVKQGIDWAASNPTEPAEHMAAMHANHRLNELLENINPSHLTISNPNVAPADITDILHTARGDWAAGKRLQMYEDAQRVAENQTASAGTGSNLVNKLRQAAGKIVNSPKLSRGVPDNELDLLTQIAQGTTAGNIQRKVGKWLGPNSVNSPMELLTALIHPTMPAVLGGTGLIAKALGEASAKNQWARLLEATANSAPVSQSIGMVPKAASVKAAIPAAIATAHRIAHGYSGQ